jgi:phosphoglycerol geranylgeranyltransferase
MGMDLVYLEAGSGAPEHVPSEMIAAVKKVVDIPVVVGGGIRTPEHAAAVVKAGADIVVTGTLIEKAEDIEEALSPLVKAVKGGL